MNIQKHLIIVAIALFFGFQLSGQGIKSSTGGFSLNVSGVYGNWSSGSTFLGDLDDLEPTGIGFSAKVAYGINQNIEAFISYGIMGFKREFDWNSYDITSIDIGGRFNFGATLIRLRPFVEAALSLNMLNIDPITFDGINVFNLESSGIGGSIGGGLHFFILPNLSINANGRISFGTFSSTELSGEPVNNLGESLGYTVTSIHLGITYFFE